MELALEQLVKKLVPALKPWLWSYDRLPAGVHCRVYNTANLSIPNNAYTALTFDAERTDPLDLHSTSSNTSRITVADAGMYLMGTSVLFATNATGVRYVRLIVNGSTVIATQGGSASSAFETALSVTTAYELAVGDYVEVQVYQNSGGALNVNAAGNYTPEFWLAKHS